MKMPALRHRLPLLLGYVAVVLLLAKYFWSLWMYPDVPFGYDAGIYRYLFIKHSAALPPFSVASLPEWAKAHPLGLFFFSSILLKLGVPVDWLIGWVWNLFPVALTFVLAWLVRRKFGVWHAVILLGLAALSIVQYEGFLMMYWKVLAALLWCTLAFDAYEKKSPLIIAYGMLVVATHQQIGLLYVLAVGSAVLSDALRSGLKAPLKRGVYFIASIVLGALWYVPNYQRAIGDILPLLRTSHVLVAIVIAGVLVVSGVLLFLTARSKHQRFEHTLITILIGVPLLLFPFIGTAPRLLQRIAELGGQATPGTFLSVHEYIGWSFPLLALGLAGLVLSLRRERGGVWQWAALWSGIAVLSLFFFYRRFILPLDFFLLPFAAHAVVTLFLTRNRIVQVVVCLLLGVQASFLVSRMATIDPHVTPGVLAEFRTLPAYVPAGSKIIVLDSFAPWVLGMVPEADVSGPGIFDSKPLAEWESFLFGSDENRSAFIGAYPKGTFFYVTDLFRSFYPPEVQTLLDHRCLEPTGARGLYRSRCGE